MAHAHHHLQEIGPAATAPKREEDAAFASTVVYSQHPAAQTRPPTAWPLTSPPHLISRDGIQYAAPPFAGVVPSNGELKAEMTSPPQGRFYGPQCAVPMPGLGPGPGHSAHFGHHGPASMPVPYAAAIPHACGPINGAGGPSNPGAPAPTSAVYLPSHHGHYYRHREAARPTILTPPPSDGSDGSNPRSPLHEEPPLSARLGMSSFDKEQCQAAVHAALSSSRPVARPDGLRKKNAKFEIPKDRNLSNLDLLIAEATNENERREYKLQKRLLRNREAALHSRQKKKNYTEVLEHENQTLRRDIERLQHQMTALHAQVDTLQAQRQEKLQPHAYEERIFQLQGENTRMISNHSRETLELRNEIASLQHSLHNAMSSPLSSVPSSAGFADFSHGLLPPHDAPPATSDWEKSLTMHHGYSLDASPDTSTPDAPAHMLGAFAEAH